MFSSASRELLEDSPTSDLAPRISELLVYVVASEPHPMSGEEATQACRLAGIGTRLLRFEHDLTATDLPSGSSEVVLLLETGTRFPQRVEQLRKLRRSPCSPAGVLVGLHRNEATTWDYAAGFDDFILRPYRDTELAARTRALLWRKQKSKEDVVVAGRLTMDVGAHRATIDGEEVTLTAKEFAILVSLVTNKGALVTRERILLESWQELSRVNPRMLDAHVSHLRHKLRGAVQLKTVRGKGYKLDLHSVNGTPPSAPPELTPSEG
jgi:DNA-binding response OmpR family regulator